MSRPQPVVRSYLYVPGHRADLIAKAYVTVADAIVIDLEDGVPLTHKAIARQIVSQAVHGTCSQPLWVRINPPGIVGVSDDLAAAAGPRLTGVRIAKVESAEEVRTVAAELDTLHCDAGIQCTIESALGVERIAEIARADERVTTIGLGEADLAADLGVETDEGLQYARGRCVVAAMAAGLAPPVQSVFRNLADLDELRCSTEKGRGSGFLGRSAIHPRQLAVINAVYTPTNERIREARELVRELKRSVAVGVSAFVLPDGRFVDPAVVASARRTLELSARLDTEMHV